MKTLYGLIQKNAVTNQAISGVLQQTFIGLKTQQQMKYEIRNL